MRSTIFLFLGILTFYSCNNDSKVDLPGTNYGHGFEVVDASYSGLDFSNDLVDDPTTDKNVLSFDYYYHGAGVGIGDFNNDGLPDIFFAGNDVDNQLYINKGNLKFEKSPDSRINVNKVWASGVSIVDINSDGYDDIYVCQQGPYDAFNRRNLFYINNGDLTFTESAVSMGLADHNYSTQAAFFDYDRDGDLDCYVMNESKYAFVVLKKVFEDLKKKENMFAASGKLFENVGDLKFVNVTEKSGLLSYGYGLGLAVSDINNDGWPDLYISNDYSVPDFLFINQKDGTFKESIKEFTKQISFYGMGCDIADINNDGLLDIGVLDMAAEDHIRDKTLMAGMSPEAFNYYVDNKGYQYQYMFNSLQLNNGNNTFSNIAALAGVLKSEWSWAALFADFNYDGNKDYYITNGYRRYSMDNDFRNKLAKIKRENNNTVPEEMRKEVYSMMPEIKLKNKLYMNNGDLEFIDDHPDYSHPDIKTYSYGAAYGDLDNDGDIDIVINNIDQEATLLKNTINDNGEANYIRISLKEINPAKKLGARVFVRTGELEQLQEYYFVRGYESTMEEALYFGLGEHQKIDEIKIIWPDGNLQRLNDVSSNQALEIEYKKESINKPVEKKDPLFKEIDPVEIGIDFVHIENEFDDFEKEILLPQKQTRFGPAIAVDDVNNDGLSDVYMGGAKGQESRMFLQDESGKFVLAPNQSWSDDRNSEDVEAAFIDPNKDGNKDLIVLSGGSGDFIGSEQFLIDRFYGNAGQSNFFRLGNVIPTLQSASYNIIAENIDQDPEEEMLIIGAARPGKYPQVEPTRYFDYVNNTFVDKTSQFISELNKQDGLLRDACWADINSDGVKDLITVGEWQNVGVYLSENGKLINRSSDFGINDMEGWWRSIEPADLDGDGDIDFILGNVGKNFKQKADKENPLYLFANDFDSNGTLDCVLAKNYNNKIVPTRGRECSSEQMPFISKKFETYENFANASLIDILGEQEVENGIKLKAVNFYSGILWNDGSSFRFEKFPTIAQAAPINDIYVDDFNEDNKLDILLVGNDYNTEYETPRLDAGNGLVLINGNDGFEPLSVLESGIFVPGDSRKIRGMDWNGKKLLVITNNNSAPNIYSY